MRIYSCITATLVLVFLFNLAALASEQGGRPQIGINSTSGDFGTVNQGTVVNQDFAISNSGTSILRIEKIEFSMPGMNVQVQQAIEPGTSVDLVISWDTKGLAQDVEGKALLYLNDPEHPKVLLTIMGNVVPPIEILPMPAFYMSQFMN